MLLANRQRCNVLVFQILVFVSVGRTTISLSISLAATPVKRKVIVFSSKIDYVEFEQMGSDSYAEEAGLFQMMKCLITTSC